MDQKSFCEMCRKPFYAQANDALCNQCEEKILDEVKAFLEEYPESDYFDILKEMDVTKKELDKWIQKGRLELVSPEMERRKEKTMAFQEEWHQMKAKETSLKDELHDSEREARQRETVKNSGGFHYRRRNSRF